MLSYPFKEKFQVTKGNFQIELQTRKNTKCGFKKGDKQQAPQRPAPGAQLRHLGWESSDLINPGFSKGQHLCHYTYKWRYDYLSQIQKHCASFTRRSQGSYFKFAIQLKQHSNLNRFEMWSGSRRGDNCDADFHPFPSTKLNTVISYLSVKKGACDFQKKGGLGSQVYKEQH